MPTDTASDTREMRLFSQVLSLKGTRKLRAEIGRSLPEFIALRRAPGPGWHTWDMITVELHKLTGEVVTNVSLRKWAKRYGIPEDTVPDGSKGTTAEQFAEVLAHIRATYGTDSGISG